MKLNELFSPIGAPSDNDDVNYVQDLKFFIDNDNEILAKTLFPAIKKHQGYKGHPDAYKIYIKPIEQCRELYASKYNVEDCSEKITKEDIIALAKQFAQEQDKFIERGDYED